VAIEARHLPRPPDFARKAVRLEIASPTIELVQYLVGQHDLSIVLKQIGIQEDQDNSLRHNRKRIDWAVLLMILLRTTTEKGPAMEGQDAFFHYLTVEEQATACGLYLTGAGRAVIHPGDRYPPPGQAALHHFEWLRGRTIAEYQLIFISRGAGEFESQPTGHVDFDGPAMLFLFPGVWHRYRPLPEVGWSERWFSFNGELVQRLFAVGAFGPRMAVARPQDANRLAVDFDDLLELVRHHSSRDPAALSFHLLRILSDAVAQRLDNSPKFAPLRRQNGSAAVSDPVVQKALEIIWSQGQHPMSVADIARQLPVTRRTLDRRFVEATGHSVLEEINACRLSRAKRLLLETDQPVKTVAHLAGFSSTERMRVLFVEREGMSPSQFRKSTSTGQTQESGASAQPQNEGR
jgi:AraC-like DNA-binding protein